MGKKWIILAIVAMVLLVAAWFVYPIFAGLPVAVLKIDSGSVEVKASDSWSPAVNDMRLHRSYGVRTAKGIATVVFFGSSLLRLDENTEVIIEDVDSSKARVVISQPNGKTWNRVVRKPDDFNMAPGVAEYQVKLPTGVATVRGTAFSVDSSGILSVVQGRVSIIQDDLENMVENATAQFSAEFSTTPLQIDEWISQNQNADRVYDEVLLAQFKRAYGSIFSVIKIKYGLTDGELDDYIRDYLKDRLVLPEAK